MSFLILSDDVSRNDYIYNRSGCNGKNLTPTVSWENAPKETKSFAVVLFDPDADWIHWIVYNINPNITTLKTDNKNILEIPNGAIVGKNSYGFYEYGGPCPPPGKLHHYNMTVYALNIEKIDESLKHNTSVLYNKIKSHSIEYICYKTKYRR